MIYLVLDALTAHGTGGADRSGAPDGVVPAAYRDRADVPRLPLPAAEWDRLLHALGKLAIKFVSGPGAIASVLRTGLLPSPFSTKSVVLDVGYSDRIPEPIRRAVITRAGGHCEWPGGCDRPAAASDVHHVVHKKDGGPTSVTDCFLACKFHHLVVIHRWGWQVELRADGAVIATSPDGQVLQGRPPRQAPRHRPPPTGPPPSQAA
jgi:hypothetical protein